MFILSRYFAPSFASFEDHPDGNVSHRFRRTSVNAHSCSPSSSFTLTIFFADGAPKRFCCLSFCKPIDAEEEGIPKASCRLLPFFDQGVINRNILHPVRLPPPPLFDHLPFCTCKAVFFPPSFVPFIRRRPLSLLLPLFCPLEANFSLHSAPFVFPFLLTIWKRSWSHWPVTLP